MPVNLKGRSFLTLMDFTPGEIRYLLDLGYSLKAKKRSGIPGERTLRCCLRRPLPVPAVHSRWQSMTRAAM